MVVSIVNASTQVVDYYPSLFVSSATNYVKCNVTQLAANKPNKHNECKASSPSQERLCADIIRQELGIRKKI